MQEDTTNGRHDLLDGLRTGSWLNNASFPVLRYAVPGIAPEGSGMMVGAPKIGKSWLSLDWSLAIAGGGVALGKIPIGRARPVLLLALEDGDRRLQDRCRRLLDGAPIPEQFQYLTRVEPGKVLDTIAVWLEDHGADQPAVFVDTLGKVMPPARAGESVYQRDYRVGSALKRLVDDRPGATLIVNHHDRKAATDDFVDAVSGTHGLAGSADTIIVLARNRHESAGLIKITGRDVIEGEYAVSFADGVWTLDGDDLPDAARNANQRRTKLKLADRSLDILAFVDDHPEGVTPSQVEQELDLPDARRYLARMAETGRLHRPRRGYYTPVPTVPLSQVSG